MLRQIACRQRAGCGTMAAFFHLAHGKFLQIGAFSLQGTAMASINKVIIVGNLGRDPKCTFPSGDRAWANVTIATTDKWKDKQTGEMREATE